MSRSKSKRSAPKYQKAKLCALPFLLAVLGYVLVDQFASDEEGVPAPVPTATPSLASSAPRQRPPAAGSETHASQKAKLPDWSELASTHRAELNPFVPIPKEEDEPTPPKIPDELQPPELRPAENKIADAAEQAAKETAAAVDIKTLSQQPVRYFFQTDNRRVMLVGDRLLSEGQTINSYTVTHLEPNRIELEPTDPGP